MPATANSSRLHGFPRKPGHFRKVKIHLFSYLGIIKRAAYLRTLRPLHGKGCPGAEKIGRIFSFCNIGAPHHLLYPGFCGKPCTCVCQVPLSDRAFEFHLRRRLPKSASCQCLSFLSFRCAGFPFYFCLHGFPRQPGHFFSSESS